MISLNKIHYHKALQALNEVAINNLFARTVVEQKVEGSIYVDDFENPSTFYVIHPYGMSLLFGNTENEKFNSKFLDHCLNTSKLRKKQEWLQAFPSTWDNKLATLFKGHLIKSKDNLNLITNKIEENTRVNFKFNAEKYLAYKMQQKDKLPNIFRTNKEMYEKMNGSVVPKYFWKDAEQFCKEAVGFSLLIGDEIASTAYASFIHENLLEFGIETHPNHRGKGYAEQTCSALIDYCLEKNLEPVWSCRLENIGSYKLAQKIGFEPSLYIPYYRLIN